MNVGNGGAGPGRLNGGIGNLRGRYRHEGALVRGPTGAGDGAGDEDVAIHDIPAFRSVCPDECYVASLIFSLHYSPIIAH